jgi:polyhydroxyalkanoate synthase subunit PhaE
MKRTTHSVPDTHGVLADQFAELRDTWKESIEKWTELVSQRNKSGSLTPEALRALFTPGRWSGSGSGAFDAALQQVLEGPKYATLFDLDRQLLVLRQLSVQRDQDVAAYQAVVNKGWNTAFERFASRWPTAKEEAPATWRGLADRWLGVVNDSLIDVHRSDEFIEAQRKMLRSASDYRLQERKMAEAWCEAFHIPTRTEMDEMQKTVTELRRQLRSLQRDARPRPVADEAPAAPSSRRAAVSKSGSSASTSASTSARASARKSANATTRT